MDAAVVGEYIGVIFALLLLEAVLSFDNAAILAAMVRKLPPRDRRKALFYGLFGAYGLRFAVVALAFWLIDNQWVKFVGGGYLLFLFFKHFWEYIQEKRRHEEHHHKTYTPKETNLLTRMGIPLLVATIIQIELMDLAFALDQVLAAVAFVEGYTDVVNLFGWAVEVRLILIIVASAIGILMLRIAATYIVKVMDWLPILEHMAYIAVGYVGVKLILTYNGFNHGHGYHIPNVISITVTLSLFLIPVLVKLIFKWPASVTTNRDMAELDAESSEE